MDTRNLQMEDANESSVIVTTKYGHASVRLIHSIERNLVALITVIVFAAAFSILDTAGALAFLYPDELDSTVDAIFSVIIVATLLPLLRLLVKSRSILVRWADLFEGNSITTGMSISMAGRSKEEAIVAIAESVEQIGEPLQKYIGSKPDLKEFMDVSVGKDIVFDVLIDAKRISDGNGLKSVLEEYGAVIVKIVDGTVDRGTIQSFLNMLLQYVSVTGNQVGLAVLIGEDITQEAWRYSSRTGNNRIGRVLLLEKPLHQ